MTVRMARFISECGLPSKSHCTLTTHEFTYLPCLHNSSSPLPAEGKCYAAVFEMMVSPDALAPTPRLCSHAHAHCIPSLQHKKPAPPAVEVITRAVSKGILNGDGISARQQIKPKIRKKPKTRKATSQHMTIAAQQKVVQKRQQYSERPKSFRI